MYKIFYENKCLELSDCYEELDFGTIRVEYESPETFDYALEVLSYKKDIFCIRIEHFNTDFLLHKLFKKYKLILASGGLVVNEMGELLIIFRNEKWDLPKGKLKKNEDIELGAIREVEEECGVKGLSIVSVLQPTYHMYKQKKGLAVKKTHWFEMKCKKAQALTPQLEEGITKVEWLKPEQLDIVFENTYGSVTEVLNEFLSKIKK